MPAPPWRPLVLHAAGAGALGGALNAAHALWLLPTELHWHVVPAGLAHGGLLAGATALACWLALELPAGRRLPGIPLSGWCAGFVAWPPLCASLGFRLFPDPLWQLLWYPFFQLGLVASLAYLGWAVLGHLGSGRLAVHVAVGALAGVLGSAWWWIEFEKGDWWKFSPLHGVVWGGLVGAAVWRWASRHLASIDSSPARTPGHPESSPPR